MYIERCASFRLRQLTARFPAVVVVGARQVGKSTLIEHTLGAKAEYVVFDPVVDVENARQDEEIIRLSETDYAVPWDSGRALSTDQAGPAI